MQSKKNFFIICAVILSLILAIIAIIFGGKNSKYQKALYSVENFRYELAEEQFLSMNGYKDSEEMASKMAQLTEINKTEVKKLLPGCASDEQFGFYYWCVEAQIGFSIFWDPENAEDFYIQWSDYDSSGSNRTLAEAFFGYPENSIGLVRYDPDMDEFLFVQYLGEYSLIEDDMPFKERFRGRLLENGSLDVYTGDGDQYSFLPYAYQDYKSYTPVIVNPDLTNSVKGKSSGS